MSRYWSRLNDIRIFLLQDSMLKDCYNVNIEEYCVHPNPQKQQEKKLKDMKFIVVILIIQMIGHCYME